MSEMKTIARQSSEIQEPVDSTNEWQDQKVQCNLQ